MPGVGETGLVDMDYILSVDCKNGVADALYMVLDVLDGDEEGCLVDSLAIRIARFHS